MMTRHASPGEVINVVPLGGSIPESKTEALFKADGLEVIRLVLPQGKYIPTHQAPGAITVQCLEGRIKFTAQDKSCELTAGQMLYLLSKEPHALLALEESAVLVTLRLPTDGKA